MDKSSLLKYSPVIVRVGISLVFLWFGASQILTPEDFTSFLPKFMSATGISPINLIHFNGAFEIIFGILLLLGLFTRLISLALGVHILIIAVNLGGLNQLSVRDLGLTFATFSIILAGPDMLSLDNKLGNKIKILMS